jgi:hypothetical protein
MKKMEDTDTLQNSVLEDLDMQNNIVCREGLNLASTAACSELFVCM